MTAEDSEQQQCQRRDQFESVCERDDEPAIETIGNLSAGQKQHDERQELCEPDEPQIFLFPGQLPHLVAEDHVDHLPGQRRGESTIRVTRESRDGSVPGGQAIWMLLIKVVGWKTRDVGRCAL